MSDRDTDREIVTVLLPEDEYTHEPDPVPNYNESMYLNAFDLEREVGAWFRMGNRVNEGYAEIAASLVALADWMWGAGLAEAVARPARG